jgi:hypothetical protein
MISGGAMILQGSALRYKLKCLMRKWFWSR